MPRLPGGKAKQQLALLRVLDAGPYTTTELMEKSGFSRAGVREYMSDMALKNLVLAVKVINGDWQWRIEPAGRDVLEDYRGR